MADQLGNIGSATVTVELDFRRAFEDAKQAGTQAPPIEIRVELDQTQANREVESTLEKAETAAGPIEPRVELDQSQTNSAVRRALDTAGRVAGGIPVHVDRASLAAAQRTIQGGLTRSFALAGSAARAALIPALLGTAVIAQQFREGQKAADEYSKSMSGVRSALKTVGKDTGITERQVVRLAGALETQSGVAEETIQEAIGAIVRVGGVSRQNLPQVTQLMLDAGVAMQGVGHEGGSLRKQAILVGRALKDPLKATQLFKRAGVDPLTEAQKELVQGFIDTGKTGKAQAFVLDLIGKRFSGAAVAFGKTTKGQLTIAADAFEDARRNLVLRILPAIAPAVRLMSNQVAGALEKNSDSIVKFATGFIRGAAALFKFVTTSKGFHEFLSGISTIIKAVVEGVKGFVAEFQLAFNQGQTGEVRSFSEVFQGVVNVISVFVRTVLPVLGRLLGLTIAGFVIMGKIVGRVAFAFVQGIGVIRNFIATMIRVNVAVLQFISGVGAQISGFVTRIAGAIAGMLGRVADGIRTAIGDALNAARNLGQQILDTLSTVNLFNMGKRIIGTLLDGIKAGFEEVKDFVSGIAGKIADLKGPIEFDRRLLIPQGQAIMQGFDKGLRSRWNPISSWINNIGGFFRGAVSGSSLHDIITDGLLGRGGNAIQNLNDSLSSQMGLPTGITGAGPLGFLHPTANWADTLSMVRLIERVFGVGMTSGMRSNDSVPGPGISQHTLGQAADFGDSRASHETLTRLAAFASRLVGGVFSQVIWQNKLWSGGGPIAGSYVGGHLDHVHLGWQGRAAGGGVRKGQGYTWNERGSEMFVPHSNGYVMNATRTKELIGAIKHLAKRPAGTSSKNAEIHVHSSAANPAVVGMYVRANLGAVFSRA